MIDDLMKQMNEYSDDELENLEKKGDPSPFPKTFTFYLHSSKESNYEMGEELGLSGQALDNFRYVGYEVELSCIVLADGTVKAITFNGVPLSKPTEF